ncbi:hypothetical protein Mgra_00002666 [Meloidogyne graminicola]|uniref:Anti-silencing factor n=1 Tax=Meloidogyne graminicola TaxID=189291 RepID=A0A8S9ZXF1_9BILA|nr:hypothetical protein Mgra_00002666 [Meloidogyne graminicola]
MCSRVNVVGVRILENPSKPTDPFRLEITFELFENIKEDVEWELVFVATDGKEEHDQMLDSVVIGQVREGRHKFDFEAPAPQLQNLRPEDFMDVTLLLLKCKYRDQLFMKIEDVRVTTYPIKWDEELNEVAEIECDTLMDDDSDGVSGSDQHSVSQSQDQQAIVGTDL